ncbi:MAG: hypothetical protein AB1603_08195, partial [Chloroflexota bacterium]
ALAVLTGLAGAYPIPLGPKVKVSLATAPTFVAVLLLPPALAATAVGLGMATSQVVLKWRWPHILLNSAMTVLCVGGAGLAYAAVNPTGALFFSWPTGLAGTALAAATIYLVNRIVVAGVASIQTGKNQFRLWQREWKQDAIQDLALFSLGFAGALAYHLTPWALAFLALAVVIAHKAFARVMVPSSSKPAAVSDRARALVAGSGSRHP